jgi:hypothetical protein
VTPAPGCGPAQTGAERKTAIAVNPNHLRVVSSSPPAPCVASQQFPVGQKTAEPGGFETWLS